MAHKLITPPQVMNVPKISSLLNSKDSMMVSARFLEHWNDSSKITTKILNPADTDTALHASAESLLLLTCSLQFNRSADFTLNVWQGVPLFTIDNFMPFREMMYPIITNRADWSTIDTNVRLSHVKKSDTVYYTRLDMTSPGKWKVGKNMLVRFNLISMGRII